MKRFDPAPVLLLFLVSFMLYVRTLAPSLLYGDSAEFQTIAYTLGVGHPTGYPVYVLLAKLFTFLPFGEIAYRVNLFSAFCAALSVALVYLIIRKLGGMFMSAIFGALTLALTPLFWKHASIAEIYAPSAACLAFILFGVLQWKETNNPRWLFITGLFGGLSLGIHTTVALSGIALLLYLALSGSQQVDWLQATQGAFVGVVIFLGSFLFLDFLNSPAGYFNTTVYPSLSVWGMTNVDFDSPFERLAFLYFPPQFKGQVFSVSSDEVKTRLTDFTSEASWSLWLGLLGFTSLLIPRKDSSARWREAILLILAFLAFLTFALTYDVFDFYVYYIPTFVVLGILVGLGVDAIVEAFVLIPKLPHFVPTVLSSFILIAGFYSSIDDIALHLEERIPPGLEDWELYFFEYPDARRLEAEQIVSRIEDNAILFTDWDHAYDFYHVAHILQGRTDTDFHETYPQEGVTQLADSAIEYIEANIDSRPIYFNERPSQLMTKYEITRAGSGLFRIERK
jgi:Protein O-mannosyl-transferase TMEM260-like